MTGARVAEQGPVVRRDVMVAMRDGVRLATDVYLPADAARSAGARWPVLLERTPYGKDRASRAEIDAGMAAPRLRSEVAAAFVAAGYAVVVQDCRGRYGSDGTFAKYVAEGPDGYDTMAWIVGEPWCDGRIGTFGLSYAAHTQMAAACLDPPGLACMVVDSGGFSSAYRCGVRQGGAFELKQATWAYKQAKESAAGGDPARLRALEAEDLHAWFRAMPWSTGRSPLRHAPDYEAYLLDQWQRGTFDDYWRQIGLYAEGHYGTMRPIPVALMSSWYDAYVTTTFDNYAGLKRAAGRHVEVIMGPWTHGNRNQTAFGDVDFGREARFDGHVAANWIAWRRAFFDRWLKGAAAPDGPRVRYFLMGGGSGRRNEAGKLDHGGRWCGADDWPIPGTLFRSYYLDAAGALVDAPPPQGVLRYDFDPDDPVPTIGGALTSGEPIFEGGAFDQREDARFFGCTRIGLPLAARRDVFAFETPPLPADVAVAGPIVVELFVSSDAPDTDFTAKLVDVHPPNADYPAGFAMNVTDGIFRCRYRDGFDRPALLVPGEVVRIAIEPFATANLFRAGHRLRVDVSSSNFPRFDVNPNTGEPEGRGRTRNVARNAVHVGGATASRIVLPIVPAPVDMGDPT